MFNISLIDNKKNLFQVYLSFTDFIISILPEVLESYNRMKFLFRLQDSLQLGIFS